MSSDPWAALGEWMEVVEESLARLQTEVRGQRAADADGLHRVELPGELRPAEVRGAADDGDSVPLRCFRGVWSEGRTFQLGDVVVDDGSSWVCVDPTPSRPGTGAAWRLLAKKGRDGRDRR
jgi:hypothetical protein